MPTQPTCLDHNFCKSCQKSAITVAFLALNLGRLSASVFLLDALGQNTNRNKCRFMGCTQLIQLRVGASVCRICTNMNLCGETLQVSRNLLSLLSVGQHKIG